MGKVSFDNVGVFNFDFDESPLIKCYTNGGLLGKGVIKEAVWQIDYQKKIISIADKVDKMPNLEGAIRLKVELDNVFNLFIAAEINGRSQKFIIDFGYGGLVSLTEKTALEYEFTNTVETKGEGTLGANGVSETPMFISTAGLPKIAGQRIMHPVIFYSKPNNYNLIGSQLTKHFIVTLNFKDKELLLTPVKQVADESFKTFGLDLNVNEKEIYVSRIYKRLGADTSGVQLKDRIISVNDQAVDSLNLCYSFFMIREIFDLPSSLSIVIQRDGVRKNVILHKMEIK